VARPTRKGEIGMFIGRRWYMLTPKFRVPADPVGSLDVEILQKNILEPVFHIEDPRTDPKIAFVGGIKWTKVLEEMADTSSLVNFFNHLKVLSLSYISGYRILFFRHNMTIIVLYRL